VEAPGIEPRFRLDGGRAKCAARRLILEALSFAAGAGAAARRL